MSPSSAFKMLSLLLLLVAPGCLAIWRPFIRDPFFDPPMSPFNSLPTFMDSPFPTMGYPSSSKSFNREEICRKIEDISGLSFPPYSQVPKDQMKEGDLLKESVKQTTYQCKDNDNKVFYMLRSNAVFATGNIHNKQNTANYYDDNKKPISYSSLKIDHKKLWDFIEKEDEHKERKSPSTPTYFNPFWTPASTKYWQDTWREIESSKPKCEKREPLSSVKYPEIDVKNVPNEEGRDVKHETFLCENPKTGEHEILLKTIVRIRTKNGGVINRYQSVMIPADKDGNPIDGEPIKKESGQSVSHSTLSAVSREFTRR